MKSKLPPLNLGHLGSFSLKVWADLVPVMEEKPRRNGFLEYWSSGSGSEMISTRGPGQDPRT